MVWSAGYNVLPMTTCLNRLLNSLSFFGLFLPGPSPDSLRHLRECSRDQRPYQVQALMLSCLHGRREWTGMSVRTTAMCEDHARLGKLAHFFLASAMNNVVAWVHGVIA